MRYILIALLVTGISAVHAESALVFSGVPKIGMAVSGGVTPDSYKVIEITDEERRKALGVKISVENGEYFWASFGNKPLMRIDGKFDIIFVAVDGSGYIKINNSHGASFYGEDFPFNYIEHRQSGFMISTLFGSSE